LRDSPAAREDTIVRWTVKCGDILDEPADVLICSANIFLNLSGGVGGGDGSRS
jgi:hypothetical protein